VFVSFRSFTLTEVVRDMPGLQEAVSHDGLAILERRGKAPLVVVRSDLTLQMLCVVNQMQCFLSDPTIARLARATGMFSPAVAALNDEILAEPDWLPNTLAGLQAVIDRTVYATFARGYKR
jgi:hypothetical protein